MAKLLRKLKWLVFFLGHGVYDRWIWRWVKIYRSRAWRLGLAFKNS